MVEAFMPVKTYVLVRFGKWDELLAASEPDKSLRLLHAMWHWGRGMADVAFQLLLTFAFVLIFDDLVKLAFGPVYQSPPTPRALSGAVSVFGSVLPVYHLFILGAGCAVARPSATLLRRAA